MITAKMREEVLLSGPCAYCGDIIPSQVDHIMPRSRGGTDDWENLAPACRSCNMEKLDFTPEEYRAYREEQGLGWPPEARGDRLLMLIREVGALHGMSEEEAQRLFLDNLLRHGLPDK